MSIQHPSGCHSEIPDQIHSSMSGPHCARVSTTRKSFSNPLWKRAARHILTRGAGLMIKLGFRCFAFVMLSLPDNGDSVALLNGPIPAISPCPAQPYKASEKLLLPQRLKNGSALVISLPFHRKRTKRHEKTGFPTSFVCQSWAHFAKSYFCNQMAC